MCHVFRCDIPARIIANTLRDICKKIMIERSLQKSLNKHKEPALSDGEKLENNSGTPTRPTDLPMEQGLFHQTESQNSFTGMDTCIKDSIIIKMHIQFIFSFILLISCFFQIELFSSETIRAELHILRYFRKTSNNF